MYLDLLFHFCMDQQRSSLRSNTLAKNRDRHLLEWVLFMLVAFLSLRAAWYIGEGNTHDFFWKAWDGLGYYQWLPSAFVTGDFDWMFWGHKVSEDKAISLFTLGVAVLQLPFFLASQWLTWVFEYPNTGFNPANAVAMMAATATYAGAGVVLSFKLARRYSNTLTAGRDRDLCGQQPLLLCDGPAVDVACVFVLPHHPVLLVRAADHRWTATCACAAFHVLRCTAPADQAIERIRDRVPVVDGVLLTGWHQGRVEEPGPPSMDIHHRAGPCLVPWILQSIYHTYHRRLVCQWVCARVRLE